MIILRRSVPATAATLAAAGLPPVLARIYASRGIASTNELDHSLAALPDFSRLRNIESAAERLARAITRRERILIVADYDADGATACAVGVRGLRMMGAEVDFLVPNRFEFGYGLTPEIVALAAQRAPRLIVTVDNGIGSVEGVAAAAKRGIDVLVTDHHLPGPVLPSPAIIVDPNQPGCDFPSKNIAGVGVIFYVLCALRAFMRSTNGLPAGAQPVLATLLDLVALGTVADVVRLDQVNRILVEQGLARIRAGHAHPGVAALFAVAGRDTRTATPANLGFAAGPRLNAAGRLADMSVGIRCLLADTDADALPLARELDRLNRARREIESSMQDEALADVEAAMALAPGDSYTLCIHRPQWHAGVVGIVASRLKDHYHRPVIVFATSSDSELKGSGRSIAGFHLRDALDLVAKRAPEAVTRYGGHAYAAGVSIPTAALERFAEVFESVARQCLPDAALKRIGESDGDLDNGELTTSLCTLLDRQVWGQGFPPPAFDGVFDVVAQRKVGDGHAKLTLARAGEQFAAIAFRRTEALPPRIHALYRPEINAWNGSQTVELVVEDYLPV